VSFPRDSRRTTGKDFETSRVPPKTKNGCREARSELDDLFNTGKAFAGIRDESEVSAGLRSIGRSLQPRSGKAGKVSLLRTGGRLLHQKKESAKQ